MSDAQHGGMADRTVIPMPPEQARVLALVPDKWGRIPSVEAKVHDMIVYALRDRGLIETRWDGNTREWRRAPA